MRAEVIFPKSFSAAATSFIRQLLTRDPAKRLGRRGADQIKKHAFFKVSDCLDNYSDSSNHINTHSVYCAAISRVTQFI